MFRFLKLKNTHLILFSLSLFAFLFSIGSEIFLNKKPCQLCLISRFSYFFIFIISFILLFFNIKTIRKALFISILSLLFFSLYHLGVENHWWPAPAGCRVTLPSLSDLGNNISNKEIIENSKTYCDRVNWTIFGISSTLLNFALSCFLFWFISISYALNIYINKEYED